MSPTHFSKLRTHKVIGIIGLLIALATIGWGIAPLVQAQTAVSPDLILSGAQTAVSLPAAHPPLGAGDGAVNQPLTDTACRLCHSESDTRFTLPSGESLAIQIDLATLDNSVHGQHADDPLVCTACHQPGDNYRLPHEPVESADRRSYQIARSASCERCHNTPHLTSHPGPQAENPVVCTDCHGDHDVQLAAGWQVVGTCVACHSNENVAVGTASELTTKIVNGLFSDKIDNDYCLACHSQTNFSMTLPEGEALFLTINGADFQASVHGDDNAWQPLNCTDCHDNYEFPHRPANATTKREYSLKQNELCSECHEDVVEATSHSTHALAREEGMMEAAVCVDCHNAHYATDPHEPRSALSQVCEQCHSTIYKEYAGSVHGDALLTESVDDVPTCIDCHGVHDINDPTTALFRVQSPELCATCHADEPLMNEYEISTDVFDTYVADFHGTTVTLFDHQDPDVETNKAVCYDCHGVHNIKEADDPVGVKANLLETCRQCHPDATANFPDSWTSHFQPSLEHNPLVYLINLFYKIVIPLTLALFLLLVGTDIYRRVRVRLVRS